MSDFGFDVNKEKGLPRLSENYWKEQKEHKESSGSEINTIFDENLNVSLKDLPFIFGKRKK